ncbi:MAG TPA: VIT1/CCC1 transporter family protein [Acidobacteriaceae bacterium]|nr:VIT1/CCC1 transporter family protein [Acidobacteriaceae bacterium]
MLNTKQTEKLAHALQANWKAEMRGFFNYSLLAEREPDPTQRRALRGLATAEKHHADMWADRLHALGAPVPVYDEPLPTDADIAAGGPLSLRALEVDEGDDIARYGEQIQNLGDQPSVDILNRIIKEEQEHYRLLQKLTHTEASAQADTEGAQRALDELNRRREAGRVQAGSWIGDAIYGVNDGLGSIFGIVSGVSGATLGNSHFVLIAGMAGMVASALSMGAGAYLAAKSEREIYEAEFAREAQAVRLNPVEAREFLSLSYQVRGLPQQDADRVVEHLASDEKRLAQALARERLNTTEEGLSEPWTSAVSGAISTAIGAFIPIVPFFFVSGVEAIVIAAIVSLAAHFAVGAAKTLITNRSWWASGWEMTWIGALEGTVTYVIGIALGHLGGGGVPG